VPPVGVPPPTPRPLALSLKRCPAIGSALLGVVASEPVSLTIVGVDGRLVRTLLSSAGLGALPGTEVPVTWDGRTDDGARVRPGLYLAVLEAGGLRTATRIPFLR